MALLAKERLTVPIERKGDAELGRRLRLRRMALGLKQWEVGAKLDPPRNQRAIASYETGTSFPRPTVLAQLTEILQTTRAYLYSETDNPLTAEARLRQIGLDPGNVASLNDERLQTLIADIAEVQRTRTLRPPPEGPKGEPDDKGAQPAADAR